MFQTVGPATENARPATAVRAELVAWYGKLVTAGPTLDLGVAEF